MDLSQLLSFPTTGMHAEKSLPDGLKNTSMAMRPDSLVSMTMLDCGGNEAAPPAASVPAAASLYSVGEYDGKSLLDILDLSEEHLFSDDDDDQSCGLPSSALPSGALEMPCKPEVVASHTTKTEEAEWAALDDSDLIGSDIPVAADLVESMETPVAAEAPRGKKRRRSSMANEGEPEDDKDQRFRPYQAGQWSEKFKELSEYRQTTGHCMVPHTFKENLPLARWVKRQRYQYKLMMEGKSSTMTADRVKSLEQIGFVWDSQGTAWGERLEELQEYQALFGHCNVPSNYSENTQLATWVKCQRRQYKLAMEGKPSNMTKDRIQCLEDLGFQWELRSYRRMRAD